MPVTIDGGEILPKAPDLINILSGGSWPRVEPKDRPHLAAVLCGGSGSGKSTLAGRLLYEFGTLDERVLSNLHSTACEFGNEHCLFALALDSDYQERSCYRYTSPVVLKSFGRTVRSKFKQVITNSFDVTIIDIPGSRQFVKNALRGISHADVAIIVVAAFENFEASLERGSRKDCVQKGQARIHAELVWASGVQQIIVCINMIDQNSIECRNDLFNEIRSGVQEMLIDVGWKKEYVKHSVPIIPVSGLMGDNIAKASFSDWWEGCDISSDIGKIRIATFYDALDKTCSAPSRICESPARMQLSERHRISGVGDVYTGCVRQGRLSPGQEVRFLPDRGSTHVRRIFSIESHMRGHPNAIAGDYLGCNIKNLRRESKPQVGDVLVRADDAAAYAANEITALVKVLDIPNQIRIGYAPVCFVGTAMSRCRFARISWKRSHKGVTVTDPLFLEPKDIAEVLLHFEKAIACETFDVCAGLGRIVMVESFETVILGKITACSHNAIQYSMKRDDKGRRGCLCLTVHAAADDRWVGGGVAVWCTSLSGSELARVHCDRADSFKSLRLTLYKEIRHHGAIRLVSVSGYLLRPTDDNFTVEQLLSPK